MYDKRGKVISVKDRVKTRDGEGTVIGLVKGVFSVQVKYDEDAFPKNYRFEADREDYQPSSVEVIKKYRGE